MRRSLSILALVLGTALLVASVAPAGSDATPRILRLNMSESDITYMDPALNYDFYGWRLESATCAMLLTYPDRPGRAGARLVPEVAAGFPRVSQGGKTYTFTVRSGFRFSDGTPVTAAGFAHAINRGLNPKMQSPAASFLADVVGAGAVTSGKRQTAAGVTVAGNRLTIRLAKVAPDFLARIAMPFFCAIPADLPIDPKGVNVLPGAGPYYVAEKVPNRLIVVKKNPYYRGPRPQRWDEMRVTVNVNTQASYLQVRKGDADLDLSGLPPSAHSELTDEFGINRGRYFVYPINSIQYLALNTSRGFFRDARARRAVNFALDRPALLRTGGLNAGRANEQLLPPGIPGYRDASIYPLGRPNPERARQLLGGREASVVLYIENSPASVNSAQIVQANLKEIGLDVQIKQFTFGVVIEKAGRQGEPFDMFQIGWFADYPDPYDFINVLLYGKTITKTNNVNTAYFDDPVYNRKMEQAARLTGDLRYRTYGNLDIEITRKAAPFAVTGNSNQREFVSSRIGCPVNSAAWGGLNLVMLCPK
jgi:ABC-type transport system substrate-binding protein